MALPPRIQEALGELVGTAREGLLVLSVGARDTLSENRRQVHVWERTALDHLREGRPEQALALYRAHDRLVIEDTAGSARERLVDGSSRQR